MQEKNPTIRPRDFNGQASALDGASILITGGTGSFGRAMVRCLLEDSTAKRIAIFSRDELKQSEMEQELRAAGHDMKRVRFFLW